MTFDTATWVVASISQSIVAWMYLSGRWTDARWAWICGGFFMLCVVRLLALLTSTP